MIYADSIVKTCSLPSLNPTSLALRALVFAVALASSACGGDEPPSNPAAPPGEVPCPLGDRKLEDGRCQPPGLPLDMPCQPGETPLPDGSCQPAGVPPSKCGAGFEPDGEHGCRAILPEEPCPDGMTASLGETECREVAPCGAGDYGDIPVGAGTMFVSAAYAGVDSDGTEAKPWKKIQDGINAAEPGAVVAVAAGIYEENVAIKGPKHVHLWGRCPSMVTLKGVKPGTPALVVYNLSTVSSQILVRGLAITGPHAGIVAENVPDLLLESLWVHDNPFFGIWIDDSSGAASVTLRSSLIERARGVSVGTSGHSLTIEDTTVRDSHASDFQELNSANLWGQSFFAQKSMQTGAKPALTIRRSVVERPTDRAVEANDAELLVENLVVRGGKLNTMVGAGGAGIVSRRSNVTVRASVFERLMELGGAIIDSEVLIEQVTMRDITPLPPEWLGSSVVSGAGLLIHCKEPGQHACVATVRESVFGRAHHAGLHLIAVPISVEGTRVHDIIPYEAYIPYAVYVLAAPTVEIRRSVVERAHNVGILVLESDALVEESLVRDVGGILPFGACIEMTIPITGSDKPLKNLTLRASLLEGCEIAGLRVESATAKVEDSVIRGALPDKAGNMGDGIAALAQAPERPTSVTVTGVRIEESSRASISSFGATVGLGNNALSCAAFELVGEAWEGSAFSYQKLGDNACGCPQALDTCQVLTPGFAAPPPLPSDDPPIEP